MGSTQKLTLKSPHGYNQAFLILLNHLPLFQTATFSQGLSIPALHKHLLLFEITIDFLNVLPALLYIITI